MCYPPLGKYKSDCYDPIFVSADLAHRSCNYTTFCSDSLNTDLFKKVNFQTSAGIQYTQAELTDDFKIKFTGTVTCSLDPCMRPDGNYQNSCYYSSITYKPDEEGCLFTTFSDPKMRDNTRLRGNVPKQLKANQIWVPTFARYTHMKNFEGDLVNPTPLNFTEDCYPVDVNPPQQSRGVNLDASIFKNVMVVGAVTLGLTMM